MGGQGKGKKKEGARLNKERGNPEEKWKGI
jgi:hypothetical protein